MPNQQLNTDFFSSILSKNTASLPIDAQFAITASFKGQGVVACQGLDVKRFAQLNHCELVAETSPTPNFFLYWGGEDYDRLYRQYEQVCWQICWNGNRIQVVHLEWDTGCGQQSRDWVVADTTSCAEDFMLDVERKTHAPGNAILVFSSGYWQRNTHLYEATQAASFDDLILADDLKSTIRTDFSRFLESQDRYKRLGIAWRRGALIIGPPGNGKTHCVRALVKELAIASLYVQSLSHHSYTAEQLWHKVFERARGLRPCVLVLEDLDSLVTDENRSFFLNQLDGFEQNHGLIVLATTNHPERIDSAIIDRPSRFDRKYHFNLPTAAERHAYLDDWQHKLASETGWKSEETESVVSITEGYSFAYLKELVISTVMQWLHVPNEKFIDVMRSQARLLMSQMQTHPVQNNGAKTRKRGSRVVSPNRTS